MVVLGNCGESESDKAIEYSEESNYFYFPPSPQYFPPLPTTFPPSPSYFPPYSPASSNSSKTYGCSAFLMRELHRILPPSSSASTSLPPQPQQPPPQQQQPQSITVFYQERLQTLIDGAREPWTYAIFWQSNSPADSTLCWGDGYYKGEEDKGKRKATSSSLSSSAEEQAHRKKVLRELNSLISGASPENDTFDEEITDTEWFFLVSMTLSFGTGYGLPGQALYSSSPIWVAGAERLAGSHCEMARQGQVFGLQTIVCIPSATGVVELGSTELIYQTSDLMDKVRFLFNFTDTDMGSWTIPVDHVDTEPSSFYLADDPSSSAVVELNITPSITTAIPSSTNTNSNVGKGGPFDLKKGSAYKAQPTVDTNSVLAMEVTPLRSSLAAQQENPDEDFVDGQVEQVGIVSEGTEEAENAEPQLNSGPSGKRKRKEKNTREGGNKKTTGVRNVIPLEDISEIKEMHLKDAAMHLKDAARHLNVSQSTLKRACREDGINKWPTRNEHKHLRQSLPNKTPAVVNQEGIPQLTFDTLPFDNPLTATVNTNSVIEEVPLPQFSPAARQENPEEDFSNNELEAVGSVGTGEGEMNEAQLNSECLGNGKSNEKTQEEERSNNKTAGVRIAIALEDILQTKEMLLKDAAKHLKVSRSKLKSSCREYDIHRWPPRDEHKFVRQSLPNEIPAIVDQDGILQLISSCVPSNQPLMATVDTNSVVKEIPAPWILPTARQENGNENFATDEIEVIGMRGVGTGEGEMEVDQLNSGCSRKRKTIEKTSRGERGNNKTTGVRIAIPLEDILRTKEMRLKDAAKHLNVSRSTLKRACREYNIHRWPPREELKLLSQYSLANKSPTVVDQGQIPQLNDDMLLPSNQVPTTVSTNSTVTVKVRCGKETIKFRLSWPWETVELKQQVKKRLELEDGTYYIRYKDEDGELILIACDDDLQECISSSSPLASKSIEILLEPK